MDKIKIFSHITLILSIIIYQFYSCANNIKVCALLLFFTKLFVQNYFKSFLMVKFKFIKANTAIYFAKLKIAKK